MIVTTILNEEDKNMTRKQFISNYQFFTNEKTARMFTHDAKGSVLFFDLTDVRVDMIDVCGNCRGSMREHALEGRDFTSGSMKTNRCWDKYALGSYRIIINNMKFINAVVTACGSAIEELQKKIHEQAKEKEIEKYEYRKDW